MVGDQAFWSACRVLLNFTCAWLADLVWGHGEVLPLPLETFFLMPLLIYIITFTLLFIFFTKINFNVHPFKVYRLVGFHVSSV